MSNKRDDVSGLLLLDKPLGLSSNQALQDAKYLLNAKKAGHTGSLDPLATGLLPLCFGEATKLSSYLLDADKSYQAKFKLGQTTDTYDSEGEVIEVRPVEASLDEIARAMSAMIGTIDQVPPMYSALKRDGQPLYKLARQGVEVERQPRRKQLHRFEMLGINDDEIEVLIECSSGFYVRSLAYDLGEALGCGAHVTELRRLTTHQLSVEQAVTMDQLRAMTEIEQRQQCLQAFDPLLSHIDALEVNDQQTKQLFQGQTISQKGLPAKGLVRLYMSNSDQFIGIGLIIDGQLIKPKRLVNPNSLNIV